MQKKTLIILFVMVFVMKQGLTSTSLWAKTKKDFNQQVAQTALQLYNKQTQNMNINGRDIHIAGDCSNFVRGVFWLASNQKIDLFVESTSAGIRSNSGTALISKLFEKKHRFGKETILVGDVVVFDNTYDKNKNQKRDDAYTHIGVVTKVHNDGLIEFVHGNYGGKIKKGYLHLQNKQPRDGQKEINSYLRRRYSWEKNIPSYQNASFYLLRGFGGY